MRSTAKALLLQAYVQELDEIKQILVELLSKCILVEQPRLDQVTSC